MELSRFLIKFGGTFVIFNKLRTGGTFKILCQIQWYFRDFVQNSATLGLLSCSTRRCSCGKAFWWLTIAMLRMFCTARFWQGVRNAASWSSDAAFHGHSDIPWHRWSGQRAQRDERLTSYILYGKNVRQKCGISLKCPANLRNFAKMPGEFAQFR